MHHIMFVENIPSINGRSVPLQTKAHKNLPEQ